MLSKMEEILTWEKTTDQERDSKFVEMGRYLREVRAWQYWRVDSARSFAGRRTFKISPVLTICGCRNGLNRCKRKFVDLMRGNQTLIESGKRVIH